MANMVIHINDDNSVGEYFPEINPVFPEIPLKDRYTKEFLDHCIIISEEEFFNFQNLIRLAVDKKPVEPPNPNEHPKIKAMKAKARYRDQIKAKQNAKNGITLFTTMASICCMGVGLSPLNIGEISYVAMQAVLGQYQNKEKYQIDIDSLLAGADSKKIKPVYWIKNLEE